MWRLIVVLTMVFPLSCGGTEDVSPDAGGGVDAAFVADTAIVGGPCADCAKDNDCGPGLACHQPAFVCKTPKQVKAGLPICGADCQDTDDCAKLGLCAPEGGVCQATTLAHCVASAGCKAAAKCTPKAGACVIGGPADCQKTDGCQNEARCTLQGDTCVATTGTTCGDGACEIGETKDTCPGDCGPPKDVVCTCTAGQCGRAAGCSNDCGGCAAPQLCVDFTCKAVKCSLPDAWPAAVQRVTKLELLDAKHGCDLDDTAKANNSLGKVLTVYPFTNGAVADAIASGAIGLLLQPTGYNADGKSFDLSLLAGAPDPAAKPCEGAAADCAFKVKAGSYDLSAAAAGNCPPVAPIAGAKVVDGALSAGGPGGQINVPVYVVGIPLVAKVADAQLSGKVVGGATWTATASGMLCGAIAMADVAAAVDSLPDSALDGTGFDKAGVVELVNGLLVPDWDLDGDGKMDAVTAAWSFETVAAQAVGLQ